MWLRQALRLRRFAEEVWVARGFLSWGGALALGSGLAMLAPSFGIVRLQVVAGGMHGLFFPTVTGVIMIVIPKESLGVHLAMNSGIIALGLAISPVASVLCLPISDGALCFRAVRPRGGSARCGFSCCTMWNLESRFRLTLRAPSAYSVWDRLYTG